MRYLRCAAATTWPFMGHALDQCKMQVGRNREMMLVQPGKCREMRHLRFQYTHPDIELLIVYMDL